MNKSSNENGVAIPNDPLSVRRMDESLDTILNEFGVSPRDLEISLGVTFEAVRLWRKGRNRISVPLAREIEQKFGIPRHRLRPDIWDPPATSRKSEAAAAEART